MNRREAVIGLAGLALSACTDVTPPIMGNPPISMGVSVFPGWETPRSEFGSVPGTQSPWSDPWKSLRTSDRIPLLGQYNEAERWVTEERLKMMEYAGIGFAVYQVEMAA